MSPSLVDGSPSHQPERTTLNLRTALGLYNLTDSELFWELQLDTRCLMGWSDSTIVVAFRGTASMKNALSDLQVSVSMPVCGFVSVSFFLNVGHVCLPVCLWTCW